jgi:hypothetical protein
MAKYFPPSSTNIPFVFGKSGYSKPNFSPLTFKFSSYQPQTLSAAINVMVNSPYKNEAYTYLKSCPRYVVAYNNNNIQIMKGKCVFGGIRDLQVYITPVISEDIIVDLRATIKRVFPYDLPVTLITHLPKDIFGRIKGISQGDRFIQANIHAWNIKYLSAVVEGTHDPINISAFVRVKAHGYGSLSTKIHAWQVRYLSANVGVFQYNNLSAILEPIPSIHLTAYLKIWPQEVLAAHIKGWGNKNLSAIIKQVFKSDLYSWCYKNFMATIFPERPGILNAYINPQGYSSSLHASIYPKMIRLTTLVNIPTMEHGNLSATINYLCFNTGYINLSSYIRSAYKSDLQCYIKALYYEYKPTLLGATVGYADTYSEVDKLKLLQKINFV